MLTAAQMQSLPAFFREIPDPRRAQGRRHGLSTVLGIAAGAVLCGMRGYRAIGYEQRELPAGYEGVPDEPIIEWDEGALKTFEDPT